MSNSTNNNKDNIPSEKKKISLQEAIKQKLASKKQEQSSGKSSMHAAKTPQKMKSQQTKKPNNQRKRTGV